jgi:hypothetical protein
LFHWMEAKNRQKSLRHGLKNSLTI